MEVSKPKWVNPISNTIRLNLLRFGWLQILSNYQVVLKSFKSYDWDTFQMNFLFLMSNFSIDIWYLSPNKMWTITISRIFEANLGNINILFTENNDNALSSRGSYLRPSNKNKNYRSNNTRYVWSLIIENVKNGKIS